MSYSVTATATSGGLLGTIAAKLGFVAAPVVTLATVRVGATAVVVGLLANGFYFTAVGTMFYGLRRLVLG
jgi:sugar (pentulose or hexulose) kinase